MERYVATYNTDNRHRIGEINVLFPDVPEDRFIRNIDKPLKERKFARERIPSDIKYWSRHERDRYVAEQWHRRTHGEWWLIKDELLYFPGGALVFFDFWTTEEGKRPDFRFSALQLFQFWYQFVEPHPNVFGMFNMKCRRLGDTENSLFIMWDSITRYKMVKGGMQSYTDDEGARNFYRLVVGHKGMPFFYRPHHSGSTASNLNFRAPDERMTLAKIKEERIKIKEDSFIGSYVDFEATVTGKYDGTRLFRYFLDEVFKIKPHQLDVKKQWNNIRRVTSLNNERNIVGKSILNSTVEANKGKAETASSLDYAEWLWNESDPSDLAGDGRTGTGLVRLFRDYQMAAECDEYGFPKREEAKKYRELKIAKYTELGDYEQIIDIYRKEPASPEEALTGSSEECPLYPEICHMRLRQIREGLDLYNNEISGYRPPYVEGNLMWKNGRINGEVVFVPMKNGRWHIAQVPKAPNNVQMRPVMMRDEMGILKQSMTFMPLNAAFYRGGGDPFDHQFILGKGSKAAIAIKRRLYLPDENMQELLMDEYGMIHNVEKMQTNQFVCDYVARPKHPEMFYMDIVLTCWWYGCPILLEVDRPGAIIWMQKNGYYGFLHHEPPMITNMRSRSKRPVGVRSHGDVVSLYTERLQIYVAKYWPTVNLPRTLSNWARFIPEKRTRFDLSVATGLAELADTDNMYQLQDDESNEWSSSPYQYKAS